MEWLILGIIYFVIGTAIGRLLFVKRLGTSARFQMGKEYSDFGRELGDKLVTTYDMDSAITYGLWSLLVWPITVAVFLVQLPTKQERQAKARIEYQEMLELVNGHQ